MITTDRTFELLDNTEYWVTQLTPRNFLLSDRRQIQANGTGVGEDHIFDAELLYSLLEEEGITKFAFMCGRINEHEDPFTIFFVVRDPYRDGAHVTDLHYAVRGSDHGDAKRVFKALLTSEKFSLFGF